jgi:hypothetical protein
MRVDAQVDAFAATCANRIMATTKGPGGRSLSGVPVFLGVHMLKRQCA